MALLLQIDVREVSFVSVSKNKVLFSFIHWDPRLDRKECFVFEGKHADKFPAACTQALADLMAEEKRAESEASLICSATPIMPVEGDGSPGDEVRACVLACGGCGWREDPGRPVPAPFF